MERAISLPDEARWDDIRLDLKDNRSIEVFYKKERIGNYNYETFGLVRKSTSRKIPDRQGEFLEKLAFASMSGGLFKPTVQSMADEMKISQEVCYQIKKNLVKKLKAAFGISNNPFHSYDPVNGYRPRFELRPPSLLRGDGELHGSGGRLYEETTEYSDEG